MKCLWKKVICAMLAVGMMAQCPQQIYAEENGNTVTVMDPSDAGVNDTNSV